MRVAVAILAVLGLSACEPSVPDSGAGTGVGFQDYETFQRERVRREQIAAGLIPDPNAVVEVVEAEEAPVEPALEPEITVVEAASQPAPQTDAEETAAAALAALGRSTEPEAVVPQTETRTAGAPLSAISETPAPAPATAPAPNATGISDEQNFAAVSGRETIESDAERLQAQREARQVIEPEPLPSRSNRSGPNIVAYALSTTNRVGQPVYRRSFGSANRAARACGRYATSDLAQEAFLQSGGPERDRQGLDPDGDGFACGWDPTPFRAAQN